MKAISSCPNSPSHRVFAVLQSCWCDKDWCIGQRCGANEIVAHYKCSTCSWQSEQTQESKLYKQHYAP
jgi:hypothetical protein